MYGQINEQKKDTHTDTLTHTHTHTHTETNTYKHTHTYTHTKTNMHTHTHTHTHIDKHTQSRRLIKKVTIIDEAKYKVKDRIIWKSIAYLA